MGDCNRWWCVHAGLEEDEVHILWPPESMKTIPEESVALSDTQEKPISQICLVKAILTKALEDRRKQSAGVEMETYQ